MLEPKYCIECNAPINPLPPVKANAFEEPYPPESWDVVCTACGANNVILKSDLPEQLVQELEDSRGGWESMEGSNSDSVPDDDGYELLALDELGLADDVPETDQKAFQGEESAFNRIQPDIEEDSSGGQNVLDDVDEEDDELVFAPSGEDDELVVYYPLEAEEISDAEQKQNEDQIDARVDDEILQLIAEDSESLNPKDLFSESESANVPQSNTGTEDDLIAIPLELQSDDGQYKDAVDSDVKAGDKAIDVFEEIFASDDEASNTTEADNQFSRSLPSHQESLGADDLHYDEISQEVFGDLSAEEEDVSPNSSLPFDELTVEPVDDSDLENSFKAAAINDYLAPDEETTALHSDSAESSEPSRPVWSDASDEQESLDTSEDINSSDGAPIEFEDDEMDFNPDRNGDFDEVTDRPLQIESFEEGSPESELVAAASPVTSEVAWNKKEGDTLLKRKKEPSLLRKVLPPFLGAAAAFPIALAILWYGFGTDIGGIGALVAQYVPAVVPESLRGNAVRPRPYQPPQQPQVASTEEPNDTAEPVDGSTLAETNAADVPSTELETTSVTNEPAENPAVDAPTDSNDLFAESEPLPTVVEQPVASSAPFTATQFLDAISNDVGNVVTAQNAFFTIGATDKSQQLPLANRFWDEVQALANSSVVALDSSLAQEPSGQSAIVGILQREISPWADSVLKNGKVTALLQRCSSGIKGIDSAHLPQVLVESIRYPNEIDSDFDFQAKTKFKGKPIDVIVPGEVLKSVAVDSVSEVPTLLIGKASESNGRITFTVSFASRR